MRYVRCLDKLDMTDNIIKICVNLSHQCHLCAIKHNDKLSFRNAQIYLVRIKEKIMQIYDTEFKVRSIVSHYICKRIGFGI